ncbi:MAG: HIT domain-containing protein [Ornithinimicrobium sp.]
MFEDETVVVFMSLQPVVPCDLLVVPRRHVVGLEDLDEATSAEIAPRQRRESNESRPGADGVTGDVRGPRVAGWSLPTDWKPEQPTS